MKNGFYPSAGWAWRINTVGFIDGPARNQWVVAILTDGWSDDDPGIEATEFVAGAVSYHQIRKSPADHPFIDVPAGAYYEDNAARLFTEGVLSGTSPLFFSPRSPVTRAQLAVMLSSKRSAKLPSSCASRGPLVDSLANAVWAIQQPTDFETTLIALVNRGRDADTTAAIAGGLLGLTHGPCPFGRTRLCRVPLCVVLFAVLVPGL